MKNFKHGSITLLVIISAITVICILGGIFSKAAEQEAMPEHNVTTELDTEMIALSIKDIKGCKKIESFNIAKDELLSNMKPTDAVYTHDISDLGNRGTIQILIENIDPMSEDFDGEAAVVEHLKVESNYKFSIYIPQILSANVTYANALFLASTGEIEEYNFMDFFNQNGITDSHKNKTEPLTLNVSMNAERRAMSVDPLRNGLLLTIHYEAEEGKTAMLNGDILIGEREAVDKVVQKNIMSLYLLQVLSIASLAMLIFVTVLKKRIEFLPQIIYLIGIAGIYTTAVIYDSACNHPYFVIALGNAFASLFSLGTAFFIKKKIGKVPVRIILCGISVLLCIFAFILPLIGGDAYSAISVTVKILQYLILVSASLLIAYETLFYSKEKLKLGAFAALMIIGICAFGTAQMHFFTPIFGVSILLLIITTYSSMREFVLLETRNRYLTDNLEAEVKRQTESLTNIIGERDDLLRYISHDLRKPIISIRKILPSAVGNDTDDAKVAVTNVLNKLGKMESDLGEISKFSKTNYHAEQSSVISIDEILKKIHDDLSSDCIANGVLLKIKPCGIEAYAKCNALVSILSNLIFNALEHSGCDTIEITAERYGKKQCRLIVSDNGHGATNTSTLFMPYNTNYDTDGNMGLGLYISRQFALSMGGDILYQREGNTTSFSVILPII